MPEHDDTIYLYPLPPNLAHAYPTKITHTNVKKHILNITTSST